MDKTFDLRSFNLPRFFKTAFAALSVSILTLQAFDVRADELQRWDTAITKYNEKQVRNFHPVFDFDSDGCYPATPFDRNANLRQNPGLNCVFHANWTSVPPQTGHPFHAKLDTCSRPNWTPWA